MREPLAWREDLEWVRLESPMLWCTKCRTLLPKDDFSSSQMRTRATGHCKGCRRQYTASWLRRNLGYNYNWRAANLEKRRAYEREYYRRKKAEKEEL